MEKWGIFVTKKELSKMQRRVKRAKLDVFEVRALTFEEKMTYLGRDLRLLCGEPHVIMFNATEDEYRKFIHRYRLRTVI